MPWVAAAHSGIGARAPWLESGDPRFDDEALAMLRFDEGTRMSLPSSPYIPPGDDLAWYMKGASAYTAPFVS